MKILLVVYDNDSFIHWFPQGTAYVAAALRNAGHAVHIYNQDQNHWPDEHLTHILNTNQYDVVGLGVIAGYYQYRKLLGLSEAINASKQRPFYIIAGHGPSPEPEFFLHKTGADAVVLGEGEQTAVELCDTLARGDSLSDVAGIVYRDEDDFIKTADRALIEDIDSIAFPAWDLFPMDYYTLLRMPHIAPRQRCGVVLSARGCPYKCNFCYRMDKGIRIRSVESVVEEIQILQKDYQVSYIAFSDELTMVSPERTIKLCESFIQNELNISWSCNGRLNLVQPVVLDVMKRAGCVFINYGIECMDNTILAAMNKQLTCDQIVEGIEATLAAEISPGYNIIFGNIGETQQTLQQGVDLLLKYDDHSQLRTIRPVTPYPGSPLYYYAIENGLLEGPGDFYENKHTNSDLLAVNFTELTDDEFYNCLFEANRTLLENYFKHACQNAVEQARQLYHKRDGTFRGFRQT